jgi:hypothetical protein
MYMVHQEHLLEKDKAAVTGRPIQALRSRPSRIYPGSGLKGIGRHQHGGVFFDAVFAEQVQRRAGR